jgi:hypothetical protein
VCDAIPDIDDELRGLMIKMEEHLKRAAPATELADALGLHRGVSGYVYHTVPLALYCWLRNPTDFRRAVEEVIELGGDADSTGAIVGGIAGATVGTGGIPREWTEGIVEWPRSLGWMQQLADRLSHQFPGNDLATNQEPLPLFWPGLIPRNTLFLTVVLGHVLRRLLPPY